MSIHLVLFLKPNLSINFEELVSELEENFKELKNGIILNKENKNPNYPTFVFNQNKELLIDGNNHHISINILNEYTNIKDDIIESLWDAFDYCDILFERVGYIKEFYKNIDNSEYIKNIILNQNIAEDIDEFQISFHKNIKFNRKNINCWKRFIKMSDTPLMISYDINTKTENIKEINYKTLKELIKFSDSYIEDDIKKFIKEWKIWKY